MSIDGRITVDALFHDKDGTASLKVVSLAAASTYTTEKVVLVQKTAGTGSVTINYGAYRDASGNIVTISSPKRMAFAWSGATMAVLTDNTDDKFKVSSRNGEISVTSFDPSDTSSISPRFIAGETGTYTFVLVGD
jgi:hypothetical protein